MFANFSPKNANLDNFFSKKCNFGQFLKEKNMRIFFHNFFNDRGKIRFFWQNINLWLPILGLRDAKKSDLGDLLILFEFNIAKNATS